MLKKGLFVLFMSAIALVSCNSESEILTFTIDNITISGEDLFAGANTLQGAYTSTLEDFLAKNGRTMDDVKAIRLAEVTLAVADSTNFDQIGGVTVSLVGDKTAMGKFAVLNPVPTGVSSITPSVATEQENIADYFKEGAFTVVTDVNLNIADEDMINLALDGKLTFEVEVKQ